MLLLLSLLSKAVLITGCDSGFGKLFVKKCIDEGIPAFAACLTQQGVDDLNYLAKYTDRVHAFIMNVTDEQSVAIGKKFVEEKSISYGKNWFEIYKKGMGK
ncbi:hypothetical protein L596_030797 [Steinernema carpocapsae]|uniref:Uncharacterized protein n=1 Tax=Steinernema carpocapsae TaxID=34508 RepID=A0A4U5LNT2_STECR|nr:hypothetical protein L596_030797 [Steinernema carpocapsae]